MCFKKKTRRELDEKILQLELAFLKHGQPELHPTDVGIELQGQTCRIHVLQTSHDPHKENVVFIHGFGTTCSLYYRFLVKLGQRFNVHAIDLIGMGCSEKPHFDYMKMSPEELVELFSDCIFKTSRAIGLEKFHLVAHSLGAYLSFNFLKTHASLVKSFSAVSSGGMTQEPIDFAERLKKRNCH